MRRSVTLSAEAYEVIQHYRAEFLIKGINKTFTEALNELVSLYAKGLSQGG
jgi:hypothetical protein